MYKLKKNTFYETHEIKQQFTSTRFIKFLAKTVCTLRRHIHHSILFLNTVKNTMNEIDYGLMDSTQGYSYD